MKADEMRALLRKARDKAGSQSAFARKVGVSVAHVNAVLHGKPAGPGILEALGREQITEYQRECAAPFESPDAADERHGGRLWEVNLAKNI
jgi:hypothetical protein